MKSLFLTTVLFSSSMAFASNYGCNLSVAKDGEDYVTISTEKDFGFVAGTFFVKEISKKKNFFGKVTRTVEAVLVGSLQNGGSTEESFVDATLTIVTSDYKRSTIETDKVEIAKIKGTGLILVDNQTEGFKVTGQCDFTP